MRKLLRKKEIKELNEQIAQLYDHADCCSVKDKVEVRENLTYINDEPAFFTYNNKPVPTLKLLLKNNFMKKATVDMGAIKFVTGGADVMRPGITQIEPGIQKDDLVVVIDETHSKPLAICQSLFTSEEIQDMTSGKVLKNIHYIGDEIWSS